MILKSLDNIIHPKLSSLKPKGSNIYDCDEQKLEDLSAYLDSNEKSSPLKLSEMFGSDLAVPKITDCVQPASSEIDGEKVQVQRLKESIEGTIISQKQLLKWPQNDFVPHSGEGGPSNIFSPKFCDETMPIEDDILEETYCSDFEMPEIVLDDEE
jgi:hypothetical protein